MGWEEEGEHILGRLVMCEVVVVVRKMARWWEDGMVVRKMAR